MKGKFWTMTQSMPYESARLETSNFFSYSAKYQTTCTTLVLSSLSNNAPLKYQPCQILVPQLEEHSRADKCINKQERHNTIMPCFVYEFKSTGHSSKSFPWRQITKSITHEWLITTSNDATWPDSFQTNDRPQWITTQSKQEAMFS